MHRLVGHLATSNSDSVAEASNNSVTNSSKAKSSSADEAVSDTNSMADSSNEAAMSPNKGTRSRDETMSSNEAGVSSNEVGHGGGSGSSHESNNRCKGLEMKLENLVRGRGVCVCYLHIAVRVKTD